MLERRKPPYVWVTWIAKLLAGDAQCEWAAWFRAHHTNYQRRPTSFDKASWTTVHNDMVRARALALEQAGYHVTLDDQNTFRLPGQSGAKLGGKPDLIATKETETLIIDCKTGTQRNSDYFQVLVYLLALGKLTRFNGQTLTGEVQYSHQALPVSATKLTKQEVTRIWDTLARIVDDTPPSRVPSFRECSFCEITAVDCPDRTDEPPSDEQVEAAPF